MKTADEILDSVALKHGHKDWELARYRLGENHLHVLILEAMKEHSEQSIQQQVRWMLPVINEAYYLLSVAQPDKCPDWLEGIGDCGKLSCLHCRYQKCIDDVENLKLVKKQ